MRYYEQQGVLSAHPFSQRVRDFSDDALVRVEMIQTLLTAGLPMAIIRDVLGCTDELADKSDGCDDVVARMSSVRDRLEGQAVRISEQVAVLDQFLGVARGTWSRLAS